MIPARPAGARPALSLLAFILGGGPLIATPEEPATPRGGQLVLFVGLDLMVTQKSAEGRIGDYKRNTVLLETPSGVETVRTSELRSIRPIRDPKITASQVDISQLATERVYSAGRDPELIATQQQSALMAYQSELQDRAFSEQRNAMETERIAAALPQNQRDPIIREAQQRAEEAMHSFQSVNVDPLTMRNSIVNSAADGFDVLNVSFLLASPVELDGAYVLLLTSIRAPDSSRVGSRFTLAELPTITGTPRRIRLTQYNLPPGFAVQAYEVHVYHEGREIATNLSSNRTPISRAEAHTFLSLQRELKNKDRDVPAEVAAPLLPAENATLIPAAHAHRTARVGINPQGVVTDVSLDSAGSPETDASIEAIVRATLFFPTLAHGRPVASTLTFNLSELVP